MDLATEMECYFLGYARVRLKDVRLQTSREPKEKGIQHLRNVFAKEGCQQDRACHSLSVMISEEAIKDALHRMNVKSLASQQFAMNAPFLDLPGEASATCLHGGHRIAAARRYLRQSDQWWTARVFSDRLSVQAQKCIQQEYDNSWKHSDGDVLRHILDAWAKGDKIVADRWSARVKAKNMDTIQWLKKHNHGKLFRLFKSMTPLSIDWDSLTFGALSRIMAMHCDEEVLNYLESVNRLWNGILGKEVDPQDLDTKTVEILRHKMPAHSNHDQVQISKVLHTGELFRNVRDQTIRQNIEKRLFRCHRIVTFESFAQDTILLKTCSDGLRALISVDDGLHSRSVREVFWSVFVGAVDDFRGCYIDVCLHALRNFPSLSEGKFSNVRKDKDRPTPVVRHKDMAKVAQLACYAQERGFRNEVITRLVNDSPSPPGSENALRERPNFSQDHRDLPYQAQCNRPFESDYNHDRLHWFARNVFSTPDQPCKAYPTCFAVISDILSRFFGAHVVTKESSTDRATAHNRCDAKANEREASSVYSRSAGLGTPYQPTAPQLHFVKWSPRDQIFFDEYSQLINHDLVYNPHFSYQSMPNDGVQRDMIRTTASLPTDSTVVSMQHNEEAIEQTRANVGCSAEDEGREGQMNDDCMTTSGEQTYVEATTSEKQSLTDYAEPSVQVHLESSVSSRKATKRDETDSPGNVSARTRASTEPRSRTKLKKSILEKAGEHVLRRRGKKVRISSQNKRSVTGSAQLISGPQGSTHGAQQDFQQGDKSERQFEEAEQQIMSAESCVEEIYSSGSEGAPIQKRSKQESLRDHDDEITSSTSLITTTGNNFANKIAHSHDVQAIPESDECSGRSRPSSSHTLFPGPTSEAHSSRLHPAGSSQEASVTKRSTAFPGEITAGLDEESIPRPKPRAIMTTSEKHVASHETNRKRKRDDVQARMIPGSRQ